MCPFLSEGYYHKIHRESTSADLAAKQKTETRAAQGDDERFAGECKVLFSPSLTLKKNKVTETNNFSFGVVNRSGYFMKVQPSEIQMVVNPDILYESENQRKNEVDPKTEFWTKSRKDSMHNSSRKESIHVSEARKSMFLTGPNNPKNDRRQTIFHQFAKLGIEGPPPAGSTTKISKFASGQKIKKKIYYNDRGVPNVEIEKIRLDISSSGIDSDDSRISKSEYLEPARTPSQQESEFQIKVLSASEPQGSD